MRYQCDTATPSIVVSVPVAYRRGRSCVFALHVHLVFVTKYRRGVFIDRHHEVMQAIFSDICGDFGASLIACDGDDDHVHLLIAYPPTGELSKLVNSLKGVSSLYTYFGSSFT